MGIRGVAIVIAFSWAGPLDTSDVVCLSVQYVKNKFYLCTLTDYHVILIRSVLIIGLAKISATDMEIFYLYWYQYKTIQGPISLPIFIQ